MRIPMGNFGFRGPDPVQHTRISGEGMDAVARATQNLSGTVQRIAGDHIEEQKREQDALQQVKIAGEIQDRQMQYESVLSDLGRRADAGELDHKAIPEAFKSATSMLPQIDLNGMSPVMVEKTRQSLAMLDHKAQQRLDGFVAQGMKTEARFSVDRLLDGVRKEAGVPGGDPDKTVSVLRTPQVMSAAQSAYGEAAAAKVQDAIDGAYFDHLQSRLRASENDAMALQSLLTDLDPEKGRYAGKLDPGKRSVLQAQAGAHFEQLQRRADVQADRLAREQEKTFATFSAFMEGGRLPSLEYTQSVLAQLKGSPHEQAAMALVKDSAENVGFAGKPIAEQRAILDQMNGRMNEAGSDPALNKLYQKREQALRATEEDIRRDGLNAAAERGVIAKITPLTMDIAQLPSQLGERKSQAELASTWAGRPVSPLRPQEADFMATALDSLPVDQKSRMLGEITGAVGPEMMRIISGQMKEKSNTLAIAGLLSAKGRETTEGRNVADLYLAGKDALAQGRVKVDATKETGTKAEIFKELHDERGQPVYSHPDAIRDAADAAFGVWAKLRSDGKDDVRQAVRIATGGLMNLNGSRIAKPYGWSDDQVRDALSSFSADSLRDQGERFIVGKETVDAQTIARTLPSARLRTMGDNRYYIDAGGAPVLRADGRILTIRLEKP